MEMICVFRLVLCAVATITSSHIQLRPESLQSVSHCDRSSPEFLCTFAVFSLYLVVCKVALLLQSVYTVQF